MAARRGKYPKTLWELENWFSNENACRDYLLTLRWPNGFVCPNCSHEKAWQMKHGWFRCSFCGVKSSATSGTIFEGTRKSLSLWFRAIWWLSRQKEGANAKELQRLIHLGSYETAWTWLHKLRRAMIRPIRDQLHGRVEVDNAFMGNHQKAHVLFAVQIRQGRLWKIRLKLLANESSSCIENAIGESVRPGSEIITNNRRGYRRLQRLGYTHILAKNSEMPGDALLPFCKHVHQQLSKWLVRAYHGAISPRYLDYYLDEYSFRHNRRLSGHNGEFFYRLLQQAVATDSAPYNSIVHAAVSG